MMMQTTEGVPTVRHVKTIKTDVQMGVQSTRHRGKGKTAAHKKGEPELLVLTRGTPETTEPDAPSEDRTVTNSVATWDSPDGMFRVAYSAKAGGFRALRQIFNGLGGLEWGYCGEACKVYAALKPCVEVLSESARVYYAYLPTLARLENLGRAHLAAQAALKAKQIELADAHAAVDDAEKAEKKARAKRDQASAAAETLADTGGGAKRKSPKLRVVAPPAAKKPAKKKTKAKKAKPAARKTSTVSTTTEAGGKAAKRKKAA